MGRGVEIAEVVCYNRKANRAQSVRSSLIGMNVANSRKMHDVVPEL